MRHDELQGAAQVAPKPKYRVPECDLVMHYQHPEATEKLVVPIHLVCNTPEETLIENIKANSALDREWVSSCEAHDGVAVICGSGPSLADSLLDAIDSKIFEQRVTVFAMNGAAKFLADMSLKADYQVIADAREQTRDLIGPAHNHIFASQVHPSLVSAVPEAKLLHVTFYDDHKQFYKIIEEFGKPQLLIGSHGSVGNVSLTLAYAMGFRTIHVFGFDSSFRGEAGHAFSQPMNVTEPVCTVEYQGKKYQCTFTMKSQADVFPRLTYELEQMGCTFHVHGSGFLQDRWNGERAKTLEQREADKYRLMWEQPSYRDLIPSIAHVDKAISALGIIAGEALTDFGCGTGRATKMFNERGIHALGIDVAPNALEVEIPFVPAWLWDKSVHLVNSHWGFCTDVMEHIPTEKVDEVLANIAQTVTRGAYFLIDSVPDRQGLIIGQPLHLTVRPPEWWGEKLAEHFETVAQCEGGVFICSH